MLDSTTNDTDPELGEEASKSAAAIYVLVWGSNTHLYGLFTIGMDHHELLLSQ